MFKELISTKSSKGSSAGRLRQRGGVGLTLSLLITLTACTGQDPEKGTIGYVTGYLGGVVADEPRAALVGRDVLSAGGSAADAAAAVYFALAATMPSSAGLGAGGVCLTHNREDGKVEALEFLPRATRETGKLATAVPIGPRAFYALQARYGKLQWGQVVAPAEQLARFGNQVSRALATDLDRHGEALVSDPATARIFATKSGKPAGEGAYLTQLDLAATLAVIRSQGPGDFYVGRLSRTLVAAVAAMGGTLSAADLVSARPTWLVPLQIEFGHKTAHFPPPPSYAGSVAAQMWGLLEADDLYADTPAEGRLHLLAEAAMRAYGGRAALLEKQLSPDNLTTQATLEKLADSLDPDRHTSADSLVPPPRGLRQDSSETSFVVVDPEGSAVVCNLSLNAPFGSQRIIPGLGFLLPAAPMTKAQPGLSMGPMMVTNHHVREFFFAAGSSGGVTAPTAMVNVAARVLIGEERLETAQAAKRVHNGGAPDVSFIETGVTQAEMTSLTRRGHKVQAVKRIGRVNAISCPKGLPVRPDSCSVKADPRRFGLGLSAD
ncbi:gamma-glutamyltransferase [Magnetospira sp. QH-2]|uniref:gamma-glutamyltransferase n=1 Tax=Magnetospira sp. (strain QH-2) TaxID=1288970 RepID=UPI00130E726C|nr:gamma-glutamyltransferase [Magnetospira sp. QH-2]